MAEPTDSDSVVGEALLEMLQEANDEGDFDAFVAALGDLASHLGGINRQELDLVELAIPGSRFIAMMAATANTANFFYQTTGKFKLAKGKKETENE